MTIEEVYEKYKHMDKCLCDRTTFLHTFKDNILYDLWQAIKKECEKNGCEK